MLAEIPSSSPLIQEDRRRPYSQGSRIRTLGKKYSLLRLRIKISHLDSFQNQSFPQPNNRKLPFLGILLPGKPLGTIISYPNIGLSWFQQTFPNMERIIYNYCLYDYLTNLHILCDIRSALGKNTLRRLPRLISAKKFSSAIDRGELVVAFIS